MISPLTLVASVTDRSRLVRFHVSVITKSSNVPICWSQISVHDSKLHLINLSSDLQIFMHVHPEDFQTYLSMTPYSQLAILIKVPQSGNYHMFSKFCCSLRRFQCQCFFSASAGTHTMPMTSSIAITPQIGRIVAGKTT